MSPRSSTRLLACEAFEGLDEPLPDSSILGGGEVQCCPLDPRALVFLLWKARAVQRGVGAPELKGPLQGGVYGSTKLPSPALSPSSPGPCSRPRSHCRGA